MNSRCSAIHTVEQVLRILPGSPEVCVSKTEVSGGEAVEVRSRSCCGLQWHSTVE
jgi:hypothetical protein